MTVLQIKGPELKRPLVGKLTGKLYELRVKVERVRYRLLFFFHREGPKGRIVVTSAFIKKTGSVPPGEMRKARSCMEDWLRRKRG